MGKVVFLTPIPPRGEHFVRNAPEDLDVAWVDNRLPDEEKIPVCHDADVLAVAPAVLSLNLLRHCPKVKFIQCLSAGYDPLDVTSISEMGILIANNGGANSVAVAEHTIGLMISVGKRLMLQWDTAVKQRKWRESLQGLELFEVTGKTVGIVGLGRIGKQVAKRLTGFDTETIYYDIVEMPEATQRELRAGPVSYDELLRRSDIVTFHVPLTARTRGMMGRRELGMMKPTAVVINASRGPVVDGEALYEALKSGRIAATGLDVMEKEPPGDNPLFDLDNVVITPHMAWSSQETIGRAARFAYDNIRRFLSGQPPESLITPDY